MIKDSLYYKIYIEKSPIRKEILKKLETQDQVAIFLIKDLKKHRSVISRALKELTEEHLAECLNPEEPKYKRYKITKLGKDILKLL